MVVSHWPLLLLLRILLIFSALEVALGEGILAVVSDSRELPACAAPVRHAIIGLPSTLHHHLLLKALLFHLLEVLLLLLLQDLV